MPRNHQDPVIGGIILAAGDSSRLGQPKQLLSVGEENLIQRAVRVGLDSQVTPLVVVLGAGAPFIRPHLTTFSVQMIINRDWQDGIGTSVRVGLRALQQLAPNLRAALVMTCDQPKVSATVLQQIVDTYLETKKPVVASRYQDDLHADAFGLPALFDQVTFDALYGLDDDQDPRDVLRQYLSETVFLPCPDGACDINLPDDYERFMQQSTALA